jgi:hypothetical protein
MIIRRAVAVATVLVLSGAVLGNSAVATQSQKRVKSDDYVSSDPDKAVRAFIYADHTVIELDSYSVALAVKDDSGGTIGVTRDGRYARLDGKLNHFTALVNGEPVVFTRAGWQAPQLVPVLLEAKANAKASPQTGNPSSAANEPSSSSATLALGHDEKVVAMPSAQQPASSGASSATGGSGVPPVAAPTSLAIASTSVPASQPAAASANVLAGDNNSTSFASPEAQGASTEPFMLTAGEPLEAQLFAWAKRAGWKVLWRMPDDSNWIVPNSQSCGPDFESAVRQVVQTLAGNGEDIVGDSWRGNHTIVISQSGATDQ